MMKFVTATMQRHVRVSNVFILCAEASSLAVTSHRSPEVASVGPDDRHWLQYEIEALDMSGQKIQMNM
jgi:hypothetical protein